MKPELLILNGTVYISFHLIESSPERYTSSGEDSKSQPFSLKLTVQIS